MDDVMVIGIAGGSGSGKTTLTSKLAQALGTDVTIIMHDSYYRAHHEMTYEQRTQLNYDDPASYETELLVQHLAALRRGEAISCPVYDFSIYDRTDETVLVQPSRVIVVEGILIFCEPALRELMDLRVFVDADADVRILRRLARDVRYCVEFYDLDRFVDANPGMLVQQHVLPEAYVRPFKEALLAYKLWDPSRQRFAIGWHSGPWMHDEALERSTTYDYDPNAPDAASCDDCDRLRAHLEVIGSMRDQAAVRLGEATGQALAAQALCDQREHELEELRTYVQALEGSVSFRVGRVLTAPMRFVRDRLAKPGR